MALLDEESMIIKVKRQTYHRLIIILTFRLNNLASQVHQHLIVTLIKIVKMVQEHQVHKDNNLKMEIHLMVMSHHSWTSDEQKKSKRMKYIYFIED